MTRARIEKKRDALGGKPPRDRRRGLSVKTEVENRDGEIGRFRASQRVLQRPAESDHLSARAGERRFEIHELIFTLLKALHQRGDFPPVEGRRWGNPHSETTGRTFSRAASARTKGLGSGAFAYYRRVVENHAFLDMPADLYRRVVDVNLGGAFFTSQAAANQMVK